MVLFAFNGILLGLWEIHVLSLLDSRTLSNIWAKRSSSGHELRLVCSCFLAELCAFFSQVRCWYDLDVSLIVLLDIFHPTVFLFFLCFVYLSYFLVDLVLIFCCFCFVFCLVPLVPLILISIGSITPSSLNWCLLVGIYLNSLVGKFFFLKEKLKSLKCDLKSMNHHVFGNLDSHIDSLREEVNSLDTKFKLNVFCVEEIHSRRKDVLDL